QAGAQAAVGGGHQRSQNRQQPVEPIRAAITTPQAHRLADIASHSSVCSRAPPLWSERPALLPRGKACDNEWAEAGPAPDAPGAASGRALVALICSSLAGGTSYASACLCRARPFHEGKNLSAITQQPELRPGLADVPVAESAVSFIDGKRARLEYRGIA